MKMRYIIFTAVLMCLLKVGVLAQSWPSTGLNTVGGDAISGVYGEDITAYNFTIPYYKQGNTYYWCPGKLILRNKTTSEVLYESDMLQLQEKGNNTYINIALSGLCDVGDEPINCELTFVPDANALTQAVKNAQGYSNVKNAKKSISLSISPRTIKIDPNSYDDIYSSKIYDGGLVVKGGFISSFKPNTYYSTDNTKSGILEADKDNVSFDIKSAAYKNKNCAGEKNSEIEVEFQNAGLAGSKAGNYQLIFESVDKIIDFPGTITQKALTLELNFEREYNGTTDVELTNQEFSHTTNNDIVDGEIIKILSVKGNVESADASENELTVRNIQADYATNDGHSNYNITLTGKGKINKKVLTFKNLQFEKTYDGGVDASSSSCYSDVYSFNEELCSQNSVKDEVQISSLSAIFDNKNASAGFTKKVSVSNVFLSNSNYEVEDFEKENIGKINKKKITPKFTFQKIYDGNAVATNSLTNEFEDKKLTHSNCDAILEGEVVNFSFTSATFTESDVHQDKLVSIVGLTLSDDNINYELDGYSSDGTYTGFGTIKQKGVEISLIKLEYTYGESVLGSDIQPYVTPNVSGTFTAKDKNSTAIYGEGDMLPAGKYTISYTPDDEKNYEVTNNNEFEFTVVKKKIDVVLIFEKTYDGDNEIKSYPEKLTSQLVNDILSSDEVDFNLKAGSVFESANVHEKENCDKISIELLPNNKYELNYFSATSKITAKKLENVNFYFEKFYDGSDDASNCLKTDNPLTSSKISDIIGNDEVRVVFTEPKFAEGANAKDNERNVTYQGSLSTTNSNYEFVTPIVKGKILKKELEISVTKNSVTYGGSKLLTDIAPSITPNENPIGTAIPGAFVAVNKTTNEKYSGDVMLPVGEYEVTFELPDNLKDNYRIKENKTVTVEPKFIDNIKLSYVENKIYDATTNVLGFDKEIAGLLEGDEITITAKYNDKKADDPNTVIKFIISPSESVIQNYTCDGTKILNTNQDVLKTLTDWNTADFTVNGKIEKCKIYLTYTLAADKPYDGTNDVNDFSVTKVTAKGNDGDIDLSGLEGEIYSGEKITITPSAKYNSKNVKDANTITISGAVDNENYVVIEETKDGSINQREVVVSQLSTFSKTYDGTKVIENFTEAYYNVAGIYNNEVKFNFDKAEYDSENAGTNIKINFVNYRLDNNADENYLLTVNDFTGEIKKIIPTIRWFVYDRLIEGNSTEMGYGNKLGGSGDNTNKEEEYYLKAAIYEVPYKDKYLPAVYSYKDKGEDNYTQINLPTILHPGEVVGKVAFVSKDDNYANVSSEIDVTVLLNETIEHEVATTVYGFAEIGNNCIYFYSSYYGFFKFTYYLDGQEVPEGYKPKVGKHTLYCKVEDKNGYLPEKQTETIEFTIVPRELNVSEFTWTQDSDGSELRRHYDGTNTVYENQIIEYPQLDKYMVVDGDDVELSIEMSYSSEEVGNRDVNIKYSLKGEDSYCYVFAENVTPEYAKPGEITKCPAVVGFKELDKIYGNSELGKDITATYTYVKFKGEQISVPGQYIYEIRINENERAEHYAGEMLDVGVYNMRVLFTPEDDEHYEVGISHSEYVKVTPKSITANGVTIADKYYDGNKKVAPSAVKLLEPELDGVIEKDKNNVKLEITNLDKIVYPDFKIGDYQGIVVKVNLAGSGIGNYELKNHELKAASSILPFEFFYNMEPDETGVYQLVYGTSVMGKDFKLINELTETQTLKYIVMDIDKTNQMLIPNTYQVEVQLYDSGILVQSKTVTVNVIKLKLLTTAPEIAHRKLYDGTTSVIQTGEKCVLTNVVEGDKVRIDEQIQQYDDANIGSNKTITVTFTLSGSWQSKYIEPDSYVYTDGVITNKNIKVSFLGVRGDVCPSSSVPFTFSIDEGIPEKGSITFSEAALEAGFENVTLSDSQTAMGMNSIDVNIPEKIKAGKYQAALHLESGDGNKLDTLFSFTVNYSSSYIISKFNDVVAINNAGYDFVGYQWYKDGNIVEDENKQFFNDLPCLYGWYSAKVLTVDGTYANICPRYFDKRTAVSKSLKAGVNVYPNPAAPMETVTIELEDFENYENCTIFIYNVSGVLITKIQNPDRLNTINLPQGNYTGVVVKDDSRLNFKLIVRK